MIKTSTTHYVKIKIPHPLLGSTEVDVVPTGKKREVNGEIECEGICITPNSDAGNVWFRQCHIV